MNALEVDFDPSTHDVRMCSGDSFQNGSVGGVSTSSNVRSSSSSSSSTSSIGLHNHLQTNESLMWSVMCHLFGLSAAAMFKNTALTDWVRNQIRWVVWTLASHERREPLTYARQLLLPQHVMNGVAMRHGCYTRNAGIYDVCVISFVFLC